MGKFSQMTAKRFFFLKNHLKRTGLLTALIIHSADCESGPSDFLAALHIFGQTEVMLTRLGLPPATSRRALPLISPSCAHSPRAAAFLSAERGRAEPQLAAHRPVTSVQDTPAANASSSLSRHHTHKGIAAATADVTKQHDDRISKGMFIFIASVVVTWLFSYLL